MTAPFSLPKEIRDTLLSLHEAGFEAYIVGGCVRDLLRDAKPKDWDIATNAHPEDIQRIFSHSFYENDYGTVGVVHDAASDETLRVVEVTPYRIEGKYEDGRRPSEVQWSDNLEDDLSRRDFTANAICYDAEKKRLIDPYGGKKDIENKILRTVGDPNARFSEDYLRMLRAVRLAAELGFSIEEKTREAIRKNADRLKIISAERIRDEFSKILLSGNPKEGIELAHKLGVLRHIVPELEEGIGVEQNGDHIYTVWEHNLRALQHAADRGWPLYIRLAALFHDISKPETRRWSKEKNDWTFYGHDVVGARVAARIMKRLRYGKEDTEKVRKLVRHHLFFTDIDKITLSAVRRIVRNVGPDLVWDLMKVRACDRIGMGRPKEKPYRLRKYEAMIEEAMRAPVSVGMLKIDGETLMKETGEKPGPRVGWILHALLEEVLDDPSKNDAGALVSRAKELSALPDEKLRALGEAGKEKKEKEEEKEVEKIRRRHGVR